MIKLEVLALPYLAMITLDQLRTCLKTSVRSRSSRGPPPRGADRSRRASMRLLIQVAELTRKNLLLLRRRHGLTSFEVLAPVLLVGLLGVVDLAVGDTTPPPTEASTLDTLSSDASRRPIECEVFDNEYGSVGYGRPLRGAWCVPFVYAPRSDEADELMTILARRNGYDEPKQYLLCLLYTSPSPRDS